MHKSDLASECRKIVGHIKKISPYYWGKVYWPKNAIQTGSFPSLMFIDGDSAALESKQKKEGRKKWTESEHTPSHKREIFLSQLFTSQPSSETTTDTHHCGKAKNPTRPFEVFGTWFIVYGWQKKEKHWIKKVNFDNGINAELAQ